MRSRSPIPEPSAPHRPRKRFGQHFLRDRGAIERLADLVGAGPDVRVLEIGPGTGALTEALLARGARVAAIEIDRDLARGLQARLGPRGLMVCERDVLAVSFREVAAQAGWAEGASFVLAGNLPYNISKPIALRVLAEREAVQRAVLMFQREVAERLLADPGGRDYGPLAVLTSLAFNVRLAFHLSPNAFHPPPSVRSSVTVWTPREPPGVSDGTLLAVGQCLRACFAHRRRTILNNVRAVLAGGDEQARQVLERAGIDPALRAEALPPEAFVRLSHAWPPEAAR